MRHLVSGQDGAPASPRFWKTIVVERLVAEQLTLNQLLAAVPSCPGPGLLALPDAQASLPVYVLASLPEFVPPHLTSVLEGSALQGKPQVIVLSASGAVGKSTVAREISHAKNAPLWDLSQYSTVGKGSVVGAIGPAFGYGQLAAVMGQLASGKLFLVIDALDEARLKVSEPSFYDFLSDIAGAAKSAPGVAFVLLGRTQIAEYSWLVLTDLGISTALCTIDFFDEQQRKTYLDRRLARRPETAAYVAAHRAEFAQARDLLFSQLGEAIDPSGGEKETRDAAAFLGYAPVLDAIAVLLEEEQNYHALINKLHTEGRLPASRPELRRTRLLATVMEYILDREHQQKLVKNLQPVLTPPKGWTSWDKLYSPPEQKARLLGRLLNDSWTPPAQVPAQLQQQYEDRLKEFFPEHPFLREGASAANLVFEAYLFAEALVDRTHPLRNAIAEFIYRRQSLPSRLLADFYFYFSEAKKQPIPLSHVGLLYGSLVSGETESRRFYLELDGGSPEPDDFEEVSPYLELEWTDPTADDPEAADLGSFSYPLSIDETERLIFRYMLKDASITLPGTVRLDTPSSEFTIGPEVQIEASRLEIMSNETLIVKGPARRLSDDADDNLVVLEALAAAVSSVSKITAYGGLSVRWPGCKAHPWTPYVIEEVKAIAKDPPLAKVYRIFRRIAMAFRSHKKGALARYKDKIDHARMLKDDLGAAIKNRLLKDHLMYLKGKFYFWDRKVSSELVGVSWHDLRKGVTPAKLLTYLKKFAEANRALLVQK
jgi:hypothetical protein